VSQAVIIGRNVFIVTLLDETDYAVQVFPQSRGFPADAAGLASDSIHVICTVLRVKTNTTRPPALQDKD
jgi:hypothetical protein